MPTAKSLCMPAAEVPLRLVGVKLEGFGAIAMGAVRGTAVLGLDMFKAWAPGGLPCLGPLPLVRGDTPLP